MKKKKEIIFNEKEADNNIKILFIGVFVIMVLLTLFMFWIRSALS